MRLTSGFLYGKDLIACAGNKPHLLQYGQFTLVIFLKHLFLTASISLETNFFKSCREVRVI